MRTPRAVSVWWMGLLLGAVAVSAAPQALGQPVAQSDSYSTPALTPLNVADANGVLSNDTGAVDVVLVTNVTNGTLLLAAGGGFSYLPNVGFTGNDSFTYQARSGTALSNVATATITVTPAGGGNVPPVAAADSFAAAEDQVLNVAASNGVLANDTDADADPLTAVLVDDVESGTLALQANGAFGYTPQPGFSGTTTFTYAADDGTARSNTATVTITVSAVNDPPTAQPDSYGTNEGQTLNVNATNGVLANDTDADDTTRTAVLVNGVANGTLSLQANGSFSYTPPPGFSGTTTFTYQADDGTARSNTATVTITVSAVNDLPTAQPDSYATSEGQTLNVNATNGVLANDTDPDNTNLTAVLVSGVANGTLSLQANGAFGYTPPAGFSGTTTFTYQADDGTGRSGTATVTITVNAVNDAPAAKPDSYTSNEGQTLNVSASDGVLDNDTDADSNSLTAVLVSGVVNGTLTLQANGAFSYTPPAGFSGATTFTYQADDGALRSSTVTVTITVSAVNDAPVAQPDSYSTAEDTPLNVGGNGVLGNDTDPDGDALTAEVSRTVSNGTLQLNADGSFAYTPPANYNGTTSFAYRALDASGRSAVITVTIVVTAVNDAPFISNSAPTTATEGVTYSYTLAASDPDGTTPTITAPTLPSWLAFTAPATIAGTPSDANVGAHNVTMSVTDGVAAAVTSQFQITVQGVDSAPSIAPIPEQTATENTPFDVQLAPFVTDSDTAAGSLTFAATGGMPGGLTLSAAGQLSGTPQVGTSVGTHTVRFTVSDATTAVPGQLRLVVLPAGRVDLSVTMSVAPNPVTIDSPATWTMTVTNRAPQVEAQSASLDVTFVGEVPVRFDSPPTGCTVTPSGDETRLACSLGRLAGGASTPIMLTGRSSFAGDVFAGATVAVTGAGALDGTPGNDSTTAYLSVAQRIAGSPAQRITLADARAAAAGDFNADGFDDLAVATASAQGLVLLMNVADAANPTRRTLASAPQSLGGEALATDVAVADLDRDGDVDIVTAAGNGAPDRVFLASSGTFASAALGNAAVESRAVAVGDINGDAFVDLVFANPGTSTVFINTGSAATFAAGVGVGPHDARDVLLVDVFGDSLPELVVANGNAGATVYRNTRGAFTVEATLATGPTSAVSTGDFNGDGRADLVFARDTATLPAVPSALVWLNGSNGQFFVSDELGAAAAMGLLVRDFNLDTRSDVLALNPYGERIFSNAGGTNGMFTLHPQQLATPGARGAAAGKFSNDDRVDLAVVGDSVAVFINDGSGNLGQPDSNAPTIQLRGEPTINLTIDSPYTDAGATATDKEDGDITSRIVVTSSVNTTVLGSYTVTYAVTDLSGNAAAPVTRTVNVQPQPAADGGGGGALGLEVLAALALAAVLAARRRRFSGAVRAPFL